jgi:hypothetical protein
VAWYLQKEALWGCPDACVMPKIELVVLFWGMLPITVNKVIGFHCKSLLDLPIQMIPYPSEYNLEISSTEVCAGQ